MSVLFNLPYDQQITILSEWLDFDAFISVDSALCNKGHRADFLSLLESPQCIFASHEFASSRSEARWILSRKMKFRVMTIFADVMQEVNLCEGLIALSGQTMQDISLTSWSEPEHNYEYVGRYLHIKEAMTAVAKHCSSLLHFAVRFKETHVNLGKTLAAVLDGNKRLEVVHLDNCLNIDSSGLSALFGLHRLWNLELSGCSINASLDVIAHDGCRFDLQEFSCDNVSFSDGDVSHFCKHFPNLEYLNTTDVTSVQLESIFKHCLHLTMIHITVTETMSDEIAYKLARTWPQLYYIHIHYAKGISCSEEAVLDFIMNCPLLVTLNVVSEAKTTNFEYDVALTVAIPQSNAMSHLYELYVDRLSRGGLALIVQRCPGLHILAIYHRVPYLFTEHHVLDEDFSLHPAETALELVTHSSIKTLHLHNYAQLPSASFAQLGNLEEVYISSIPAYITDKDIVQFTGRCAALHTLYLEDCKCLPFSLILPLLDHCRTLARFRYWSDIQKYDHVVMTPELKMLHEMVRKFYPHIGTFDVNIRNSKVLVRSS